MADLIKIWGESAQVEWLEKPVLKTCGLGVQVEYDVGSSISTVSTASTSAIPGLFFCHG